MQKHTLLGSFVYIHDEGRTANANVFICMFDCLFVIVCVCVVVCVGVCA